MSKEKLPFRVAKGCLVPSSEWVHNRLKERKLKVGEVIFCQITKPRNPKFNRLVHGGFAKLLIENIEEFEHMDPHELLKRLQIETGIGCKEIGVIFPGIGPAIYRIPESLSFESMNEERFREVYRGLSRHIAKKYWPDMEPEQIEQMSKVMANE